MPLLEINTLEELENIVKDDGETSHGKSFIFIDFFADWCGPCRRIAPVIEKWAESEQYNHVLFTKVNIEEKEEITSKYEISSLPTFLIFEKGNLDNPVVKVFGAKQDVLMAQLDTLTSPPKISDDF